MDNIISVIVKGIIIYNNKVLLLKRSDNDSIGPGSWEFVGGNMEFGEELEESLKREVMEEAGIEIDIDKILYATTSKMKANRQAVIIIYKCFAKNETILLSEEHSDYKWVSKEELREFLYKDILKDIDKYNILPMIY